MPDGDITKIEKHGETYHVEGVHEGRKSSFIVPAQSLYEVRQREGEAGVQQFLKRQLPHTREDARYDLTP